MTDKPTIDKQDKISDIFHKAHQKFIVWLSKKPTGEFSFRINTNQGGVRGKPKVSMTEDV